MKRLSNLFTAVAAVALFAMMWLTFADVFARKFLPNAIRGAVELTELFMLVMIFFALPLVALAQEHIVFDLLDRALPRRWLRWQKVLSQALTAAVFGAAAWLVWDRALRTARMGDITSALEIRLAPFHTMAAVMLALTAVAHAWMTWRAWREAHEPAGDGPGLAR